MLEQARKAKETGERVPSWVSSGKIPCLDGIRALAVAAVIGSHVAQNKYGTWSLGHFGVTVFFVISGFLITLLLMREKQRTGQVSLQSFYERRALRIIPAYVMFLTVIALLQAVGYFSISIKSWLAALTYTSCLMAPSVSPILAHTWSLSVEEQFYLAWPLLFRCVKGNILIWFLCACIVITPWFRWVGLHYHTELLDPSYSSASQMASIAVGCLLAFLARAGSVRWPIACLLLAGALLASNIVLRSSIQIERAFSDTLKALSVAFFLIGILYRPGTLLFRLLNVRALSFLGVLSYSLYLWQQLFTHSGIAPWMGLPALLAVSWLSYSFIERPFLQVKSKLAKARGE